MGIFVKRLIVMCFIIGFALAPNAFGTDEAVIRVSEQVSHRLSPYMIGTNLEDLNYQCYGGLYSQLLYGENFEEHIDSGILGLTGKDHLQIFVKENEQGEIELWGWVGRGWNHGVARQIMGISKKGNAPVSANDLSAGKRKVLMERAKGDEQISRHWHKVQSGSVKGLFKFERKGTFNGSQSQRITFVSGQGELGIDNAGLNRWGINLRKGKSYEGLLRIKSEKQCDVYVSLLSADGSKKYAEKRITVKRAPDEYQRLEFTLTPSESDEKGCFAITLKQSGSIVVGYAFLQPGSWGRYKNLPLRKELVEAVIAQGVKVVRYDGSMVNRCPDGHLYKWKEMLGPRDLRKPYHGWFNPYASHGFGIIDFLNFCEAAGFLPIPGVRIDEKPRDMADFVEYVNGPANSEWGNKRVADGHPKPYNLRHIEIGNEERLNEEYCERFMLLGKAIWEKGLDITLVVAHNLGGGASAWKIGPGGQVNERLRLAAGLVRFARDHGGKIWWDCHYRAGQLREAENPNGRIAAMQALKESMSQLVPDYDLKIAALEENGQGHGMRRALIHAHNYNTLERMGDYLAAAAVANTLQAYEQEIVWPQGKTFFTASKVWFQPPYYVDQMIAQNFMPNVLKVELESPKSALDVTAKKSDDGSIILLQVVNLENFEVKTLISIQNFTPSKLTASVTQMNGALEQENTLDEPEKITPKKSTWNYRIKDGAMTYTFPAYSFTRFFLQGICL